LTGGVLATAPQAQVARLHHGATPANRAVLKTACLGLGSNIGDREEHLRASVERLAAADLRVVRTVPNGPRTIDIDILLYGSAVVRTAELEIPRPRMATRRFMLAPLADLSLESRHPLTRKTVREMSEAAPK
jgi:7,8-dihydro-6-hydroxymethylpterin-pyrophosphokinase